MEPFTVPTGAASGPLSTPSRAAMRQLRPAETLRVTLREKQPDAFFFREKRYVVEHAYGPWLMSGGWWGPTTWRLQQWDLVARSNDGSLLCCCLTHELTQGCWQMAALYD